MSYFLRFVFSRSPRHSSHAVPRQILAAASVALAALVPAVSLLTQPPMLHAQVAAPQTARARRQTATPRITGSQPGTANFSGNLTTITTSSQALALARESDCTLSFVTGNYSYTGSSINYTETDQTSDYERVLHTEAGLTTTPDVFASGCAHQPIPGFGSRPAVFVGLTTSGVYVYAALGLIYPSLVNGVYMMTGATSLGLSSFQFSTAGNLTAGDLNKDGNGDLVVTDSPLASSAQVTVFLGNADGTLQNAKQYAIAGNYSVAAAVDDVNGDGNPDIVAVSGDQQISVLLGNGDGTFQPALSFPAPALPGYTSAATTPIENLITADVNNDHNKDIICSNGLVLLGNGKGAFTAAANPAFPYFQDPLYSGGPSLASGDINKDGKIDLVIENGSSIATWIGNGDGTFTRGQSYATINSQGVISVADLDGDGNPDIFVGLGNAGVYAGDLGAPNLAYALMGNGDGTFQGAPQIGFGAYTGNNLADVTGSGKFDLITNTVDTPYGEPDTAVPAFTVQLGNGKGSFTPTSTITPPASFVLNAGNTITPANTTPADTYAVGDINGDGKADLVFVDNSLPEVFTPGTAFDRFNGPFSFAALSNGDGTFQAPVPNAFPQIAPAGDFDNGVSLSSLQITKFSKSGNPGLIAVFNESGGVGAGGPAIDPYNQGFVVLPGNGNGTFGTPVITTTLSSTTAPNSSFLPVIAAIADLNGDGNPDLVVINNTFVLGTGAESQVEIYLGNGDGTFKAPTTVNTPANPTYLLLADFNKDSKLDLAVICGAINANVDQVAVLLGNGDGTFAAPTLLTVNSDVNGGATLAAADFNGDGKVDLALINYYGNSGIFYGNGDGTFTSVNAGSYVLPQDLLNIAVTGPAVAVDLNGDGKPDILVGNTVLLNQGTSTTSTLTTPTVTITPSPSSITTAQSTMVTIAVSGGTGSPTATGSVTLSSGMYTSVATTLVSGSAVITLPGSLLAIATDTLTATYTPDSTSSSIYNSATGTSSVTVTAAPTPTFALSNGGNINIAASAATGNTSTITITPANGFTGAVNLTCAVTTIPTGATSPATCGVTSSVTITGAPALTGTLTVTTTSTTTAGAYAVTVTGVSNAITQTTVVNVTVTAYVPPPTFALTNSGAIIISSPGATTGNTAIITVTPSGGFTGSVVLTAAIATSPTGATDLPTLSFGGTTPVTLNGVAAETGTLTVSTTAATTGALVRPKFNGTPWYAAGGATLACVLLIGIRARRRRWQSLLGMLALLVVLAGGVMSCGGKSSSNSNNGGGGTGNAGTTAGNYTITVSGTAGAETQTTTVNLTVN